MAIPLPGPGVTPNKTLAWGTSAPAPAPTPIPMPPVSVSKPCSSRRRTICEDGARRLGVRAPPLSSCSYCPHAVLVFRAPTPNETDCMGRLMGVRTPWGWR